jgi:hypothetical protein
VRISVAVAALVLTGSMAEAAAIPLPRPRPVAVESTIPAPPERPSVAATEQGAPAPAAARQPSACQVSLKAVAVFAPHAVKGSGQCGIADPVRLEAVILLDQVRVEINPPAVLRCEMASAVSQWVRTEMAPLVAGLGAPLRGIENFDSYDCRGRNRVAGAKMSEHGRGNALDIKGVKLASGAVAYLTDPHVAKTVRKDLRKSACERFTTVLGPGSDGYHENHIHVDLAQRSSGYRLCQWEVRQPLDRVSPSPHIANSRAPTPLETMESSGATPVAAAPATPPLPKPRRAAGRR